MSLLAPPPHPYVAADAITPDRPGFQTGDEAAKGPYCTTSPLLPLMRKTSVQVRYKKGVVVGAGGGAKLYINPGLQKAPPRFQSLIVKRM